MYISIQCTDFYIVKELLLSFLTNSMESLVSRLSVAKPHGVGGAREDRTPDPLRARQVLSQLSYGPIQVTGNRNQVPVLF